MKKQRSGVTSGKGSSGTKRKKVSEATLKRLRARVCFIRDDHKCVRCGRTDTLAPAHIYPQGRYPRMKWMLPNIITLCYACHIHWWHKNPLEAAEWIKTVLPEDRLQQLKDLSKNNNLPKPDLVQVKRAYEEII